MNNKSENLQITKASPEHQILPNNLFWAIAEEIPQKLAMALMLLSIAIPLILWWIVSNSRFTSPLFLPSPAQVWDGLYRLLASGDLQKDIAFSLFRVLGGFLLAAIISIPVGVLMGAFASVRGFVGTDYWNSPIYASASLYPFTHFVLWLRRSAKNHAYFYWHAIF